MKKISLKWSIAIALIIVGLGSCKKENEYPASTSTNSGYHYPVTINNLIAGQWIKNGGGYYVCEMPGVPTSIDPASHNIKIYTVRNNEDVQINPSILFMGGTLSAAMIGNDVQLTFFPINGNMPFSYLVIKIVIE
jgi:hypothetical protein